MSGVSDDSHLSQGRFLAQLHRQCQDRHGNLTSFPGTTPTGGESSTGEGLGEGKENTDFGAVMYIAAVLVFYSLGIVVMIVKYLKTERKELEEEMALESFFKGIPSKKMEHNREAVNRVAIRAFHTLTSGAKRQDQLLMTAYQQAAEADLSPTTQGPRSQSSPHSEDSDSSRGEPLPSPYLLQREPSKYLPRVSLIFRDNRANDRRRTYDSLRTGYAASLDDSLLPSEQRRGHSPASTPPQQENGRAVFCSRVPAEHSDHSDDSLASLTNLGNSECAKSPKRREQRQEQASRTSTVVTFVDEKRARGKSSGRSKAKDRGKHSKPSQGHSKPKPAMKLYAPAKDVPVDRPNTPTRNLDHAANTPTRGEGHEPSTPANSMGDAHTSTRGVDDQPSTSASSLDHANNTSTISVARHPSTSWNSVGGANTSARGADRPGTSAGRLDHADITSTGWGVADRSPPPPTTTKAVEDHSPDTSRRRQGHHHPPPPHASRRGAEERPAHQPARDVAMAGNGAVSPLECPPSCPTSSGSPPLPSSSPPPPAPTPPPTSPPPPHPPPSPAQMTVSCEQGVVSSTVAAPLQQRQQQKQCPQPGQQTLQSSSPPKGLLVSDV